MMRVSVAERTRLAVLIGAPRVRSLLGRITYASAGALALRPRAKTDRLVIAPQDLRTADATRASEIYAGRFAFAGKVVVCDGRSPFEMAPPSDEWAEALLGFAWLRHLRAADSAITRANARALVDEWISLQGTWHPVAWRPDILARRIDLLAEPGDPDPRRCRCAVLSAASAQPDPAGAVSAAAPLKRHRATACRGCRPDRAQLMRRSAWQGQIRHICAATRAAWSTSCERQILPDGGHISRNPGALIELLLDLLPLRQAFAARNVAPPPALNNAIDRMMPMLRFFRHGDGNFAHVQRHGPDAGRSARHRARL